MAGHRSWRCHTVTPEAPVPVLRDGLVMSSLIESVAATACGLPCSGDIPYLLFLCDVLDAEAFNTLMLLH